MLANIFDYVVFHKHDDGERLCCLMIIDTGSKLTMHMEEPDDGEGLPCLMIIDTGSKLTLHMSELLGYHMASGSNVAPMVSLSW
ncbi:hypothetical protein GUJ93_ZPchr0006g43385 [Zizania palustris]|uniref:Uncharacterized protein n=1 Tax=Zizania palustris TaxID=103762 RepID=A0A8J5T209_ZIZPA|nr:hypothetical protein GUJ93_ZPchr0006g43385 [Zizania palustris]